MLIDIHTHTNRYSPCSILDPDTLVYRSKELGLSGIAITDHNKLWQEEEINELKKRTDDELLILCGVEIDSPDGHLLIYGYNEPLDKDLSTPEIISEVHSKGGVIIMPHPFRNGNNIKEPTEDLKEKFNYFDGIEILNGNQSKLENTHGLKIYDDLNITSMGGSDAHSYDMIGKYATWFYNNINNEADFVKEIKAGRCRPIERTPTLTY